MLLTVFYIIIAVCALFVILSLQVVKAHEKKLAAQQAAVEAAAQTGAEPPVILPEEEFFTSPIYKVMEVLAHL